MVRSGVLWGAALSLLLVFTVAASAKDEIRIAQVTSVSRHGDVNTEYVVFDPGSGAYVPLTQENLRRVAPARTWSTAVIEMCQRWNAKNTRKIVFNITPDMKPNRLKFNKVAKKYHNQRRGSSNLPQAKIGKKITQVKPIEEFANQADFYFQFHRDGINLIILTNDDQFFLDPTGQFYFYGADTVLVTWKFLTWFPWLRTEGGRYVADEYITESDVYLRSDFFALSKNAYTIMAIDSFRTAVGYRATVWAHDYLKNGLVIYATDANILNGNSNVWKKISEPRDMFYYEDKPANVAAAYLDKAILLPYEGEVLDIGGYVVPSTDDKEDMPLSETSSVFVTNIKAFDGKKKTTVTIERLEKLPDNKTQWTKVTVLTGNLYDYPWTGRYTVNGVAQKVYPTVFGEEIYIGRQADLDKLKNVVKDYGEMQLIDGKTFRRAVKIRVTVKGRLTEDGGLKSLAQEYWLVNTDNDIPY